jgi:NTP pyrophosphatase (non-canonical NTP hydrolase)
MTYCIYHIPGKKIGVTNNLKYRVEEQQGYKEGEYEILDMNDDIDYISWKERKLQEEYGYAVDEKLYKDLKFNNNNMRINVTEATTTFPCPVNKLKGQLIDNLGMQWYTTHGEFTITTQTLNWIMKNVQTSKYNDNRCYIYNKALANFYDRDPHRNITIGETFEAKCDTDCDDCGDNIFNCIREWADERGLYEKGDPKTQYIKLMEEAGEVGRAILKEDTNEIIDGIGDMVVVLTNLAELHGITIEECIQEAYNVISKRTGKMVNGTFVKDQPITSYGRKIKKTL